MNARQLFAGICIAVIPDSGHCVETIPRVFPTDKEVQAINVIREQMLKRDFYSAEKGAAALWKGGLRSAHTVFLVGMALCFRGGVDDKPKGIELLRHVPDLPEMTEELRRQLVKNALSVREDVCGEKFAGPVSAPASASSAPLVNWQGARIRDIPGEGGFVLSGARKPGTSKWSDDAVPKADRLVARQK